MLVAGTDTGLCQFGPSMGATKDFMTTALPDPQRKALADACRALWLATLSLMVAFMHQRAPAHRYLLARRICANFDTLRGQPCFSTANRRAFARLAVRWHAQAERLAPAPVASGALGTGLGKVFTPPH